MGDTALSGFTEKPRVREDRFRELNLKKLGEGLTLEELIEWKILLFPRVFGRTPKKVYVHPKTLGKGVPKQIRGVPVIPDKDMEEGRILVSGW